MTNCLKSVVFLTLFALASCQQTPLICYDCDPTQDGIDECTYPVQNNARATVCPQTDNTTTVMCVSSYINHTDPKKTGIYRGCVNKPGPVADLCEWFKEERSSANVTFKSCISCNETRCNAVMLYFDGTSDATYVLNFQVLTFVNVLIVLVFAFWK